VREQIFPHTVDALLDGEFFYALLMGRMVIKGWG